MRRRLNDGRKRLSFVHGFALDWQSFLKSPATSWMTPGIPSKEETRKHNFRVYLKPGSRTPLNEITGRDVYPATTAGDCAEVGVGGPKTRRASVGNTLLEYVDTEAS